MISAAEQSPYAKAIAKGFPEDPEVFIGCCWPHIKLYPKQVEIVQSIRDNVETVVHAAHEMGKDFTAALCVLWFYCSRRPAFVATTSSNEHQLETVLWGEIRKQIAASKIPLPLVYTHQLIRQKKIITVDGEQRWGVDEQSALFGKVVKRGESFQGLHLPNDKPRTMCVFDEASAIDDEFYDAATSWADRILVIGNPLPCTNFFYNGSKGGDVVDPITVTRNTDDD